MKKVDIIQKRWENHPILNSVMNRHRKTLSILLENSLEENDNDENFEMARMDLTAKIFDLMHAKRMVSVQPSLCPKEDPTYIYLEFVPSIYDETIYEENKKIEFELKLLSEKSRYTTKKLLDWDCGKLKDSGTDYICRVALESANALDREIIGNLLANVNTRHEWDFHTALGDTIKEKYESLYIKLIEVSNVIHRKTFRGGANFIVTSPEIASIFETVAEYDAGFSPQSEGDHLQYAGTINCRWRLYKDHLFPVNKILLGHCGDGMFDAGCHFMPHHLAYLDGNEVKAKYALAMQQNGDKFYGTIDIKNFIV